MFEIKQIKDYDLRLNHIFGNLSFLRTEYPDFTSWFYDKVVPGLENGSRDIFIATSSRDYNHANGILILKNTNNEKKICTLFVDEQSRKNGLGCKFIELAMNRLDTNFPIITISENRKNDFNKLLQKFDFKLFDRYGDFYKKGITEYSYNGHLIIPEIKIYA